ncbi:MAG: hypothetical protein QM606_03155 [Leucobacter sp.]
MPSEPVRDPDRRGFWKSIAAFGFFALIALAMLLAIALGKGRLDAETGSMLLLAGGFAVAGIGVIPTRGASGAPRRGAALPVWFWVWVLLGAAMWAAVPLVLLGSGYGWLQTLGTGRRALPVWALAAIGWFTLGAAVTGFVLWLRRRTRSDD